MKSILNLMLICSLFCSFSTTVLSQNWGNGVKGEGDVVSKDLNLDKFTGVELAISGDVILTKGTTQKVRVEGQKNIIDLLKTNVSGNIWKIGFEKNVSNHKALKIYITIPTLTTAGVSGSGNLEGTNAFDNLDELDVFISGSGNVELDVKAQSINSSVSGSGNISLKGSSNSQDINISGSGDIKAFDLQVKDASVVISGSGQCELNVSQNLDARVSGSGDIIYKGDPNVKAKVTGSGEVEKKG